MIKSLLIATSKTAGILRSVTSELNLRSQIGLNWSLRQFINADLKNYIDQTHFILDVSAFIEQGDEFIELLEEFRAKHEKAVFIIYCGKFTDGDDILDRLARQGFTNIVAGFSVENDVQKLSLIRADLKECFSENGLSEERYSRFFIKSEITEENAQMKEPDESPSFLSGQKIISIFGSQSRIGTTTFAMNLCKHVTEQSGKVALVLCDEAAEMEQDLMLAYFNGVKSEKYITVNGFDVYARESVTGIDEYNLVIFDCGDIHQNADKIEKFGGADAVYLCCGVGWKELYHTVSAQKYLTGVTYTAVVNNDEETCEAHKNKLCRNGNEYAAVDIKEKDKIIQLL